MAATQIRQRQIADGAINDAKVQAGAAIATSKLADGANFILRSGAVAMTGNLDLGSQRIINVQTPSGANDAANKSYVDNLIAGLNSIFDNKASARAASTANVTVSAPGATIDGVSMVSGDRLLLKNQTLPQENGIYIWNGAATPATRATDMDAWTEVPGALIAIEEGSTNQDTLWLCTANSGGTLGTTAITWQQANGAGYGASNFVTREVPSGTINGSNAAFTLANTPIAGTEEVFLNGVIQNSGGGNDYTISGAVITMLTAPTTGEIILVNYRK